MEKVEVWKTSDGKLYENSREAEYHQATIDFKGWYTSNIDNRLMGDIAGGFVSADDFIKYLRENNDQIMMVMFGLGDTPQTREGKKL